MRRECPARHDPSPHTAAARGGVSCKNGIRLFTPAITYLIPIAHAGTCLFPQLGHLLVMNDKDTNVIDGFIHSPQSKLQAGHLNQ